MDWTIATGKTYTNVQKTIPVNPAAGMMTVMEMWFSVILSVHFRQKMRIKFAPNSVRF